MQLRITIAMCLVEIRNRKTLQSKVNICKSDVKISDYADSLRHNMMSLLLHIYFTCDIIIIIFGRNGEKCMCSIGLHFMALHDIHKMFSRL